MTHVPATLTLAPLSVTSQSRAQPRRDTLMQRVLRGLRATRARSPHESELCGDPMLDACTRAREHECSRCDSGEVRNEYLVEVRAEDIGAVMALRALLQELEFCLSGAGRLRELLRADAVLYIANVLLGWLTPRSQRGPHYIKLTEQDVRAHLARFDAAWGLRTGATSLVRLYDGWHAIQRNQQAYDKLEQTAKSYSQRLQEQGR